MTMKQKSVKSKKIATPRIPRIRLNSGAWSPLVDMIDVFPGHRGSSREGELELYDAPIGIRFEIEVAKKSEPLLEAECVWEKSIAPLCIWQEAGRYHMIYTASGGHCYAISDDAYNWNRPELSEVEYNGLKKNNLISSPAEGATGTFEDLSAPPEERFKAIGGRMYWSDPETGEELNGEEANLRMEAEQQTECYTGPKAEIRGHTLAWTSPDRIHWNPVENPLAYRPVNGGISARYDPHRGDYFCYIQLMGYPAEVLDGIGVSRLEQGMQIRTIGFSRTKNFFEWPAPKLIHHPDTEDDPDISFYGANYFAYPGRDDLHGMFIPIYHQIASTIDGQIAFSRDGLYWSRPERRAILPLGKEGDGDECIAHFWRSGIVELPDGNWACPYTGNSVIHDLPDSKIPVLFPQRRPNQIRWALWRPHRFCGIRADSKGEFTLPSLYRAHNELHLNYRCEPGGWIQVELLEKIPSLVFPDTDPVPGFSFEDCDRLTGDAEDRVVTWRGNNDISVVGEAVGIRVRMFGAKLFAYRV
ncbi:MAG: hypothetical protein DF168_01571 [Candidatus Moanabacter tarae]|uniref:Uncharacterized protein n=1 Tax=Candidatus Moanibacter tarae TaxID=2200854 RepID=A0A2Z4ADM4_9BACT|nr:MAG: hypothetical protein DF168_01571 [Candidatus Moanabacter tarae]|tara:strand:+ start:11772 stop:13355 length:1584 start_codon:yes stop_codon:yes gene_type:complete